MSSTTPNKERFQTALCVVLLAFPLLLKFVLPSEYGLKGAVESSTEQTFSIGTWFEGSFQQAIDANRNDRFGGYDYYVRTYNQIDYTLFKKANANYVVCGENNCLFEIGYLNAFRGKDFIGRNAIADKVRMMKACQDEMQKRGKLLLPVIAPGKASFYPEYIPENYKKKLGPSNYEVFSSELKHQDVKHIDFRAWYVANKTTSKYPLYPLSGIHWSNYGAITSFDSILGCMANFFNKEMPRVIIDKVRLSDSLQDPDQDIANGLNLLYPLDFPPLAYADRHISKGDFRPRVITIADSFWWYIYSTGMPAACFSKHEFWYYNEQVYPATEGIETRVRNINYFKRFEEADVIIVLYNESNLHRFSDGALEACYELLFKEHAQEEKLQDMKEKIISDEAWFQSITKKALQNELEPDSMLTIDALYMLKQKKGP